jgi:hypothetical protein
MDSERRCQEPKHISFRNVEHEALRDFKLDRRPMYIALWPHGVLAQRMGTYRKMVAAGMGYPKSLMQWFRDMSGTPEVPGPRAREILFQPGSEIYVGGDS